MMTATQYASRELLRGNTCLERRTESMNEKDLFNLPEAFGSIPEEYYMIEMPKREISDAVRQGLIDSGLSLRKAAEKVEGLSYTQIARVTGGDNYNIETLLKIIYVLGLRISIEKR